MCYLHSAMKIVTGGYETNNKSYSHILCMLIYIIYLYKYVWNTYSLYWIYIFIHKCVFLGCLPPINHFVKLVPVLHFFPELQVCMVNGIEEGSLIGVWNSISTMQDMVIGPGVFFSVSGRNAVSPGIQIKIDLGKLGNLSTGLLDFSHWDKESQINRHLVVVISHLVVVHSWRMWIYHRILFFFGGGSHEKSDWNEELNLKNLRNSQSQMG